MKTIKKNQSDNVHINNQPAVLQPTVSAASVQEALSLLAKMEAEFGAQEYMSAEDKRRSLKPRKGFERIVEEVGALAKENGLDSPGLHSDAMLGQVEEARLLAPLETALEKALSRVSAARFAASANAWSSGLQFYALLQRRSLTSEELATRLAPIEDFFSYRHKSVLEGKPTKLETRAKKQLAAAERLMSRVKPRAGAPQEEPVHAEPTASPAPPPVARQPVAPVAPPPAPATPVASATPSPVTTTVITPSQSNGLNGIGTSTTNGVANGAGTSGPS
jgi:hypothetical protein